MKKFIVAPLKSRYGKGTVTKEGTMVNFGDHNDYEDEPTSMHVRRAARKYNGHKLARGVGHNKILRSRYGDNRH